MDWYLVKHRYNFTFTFSREFLCQPNKYHMPNIVTHIWMVKEAPIFRKIVS
jgi:hypothetical protein